MKKYGFPQRFRYWFDNMMSKGTAVMIAMLTGLMIVVVILLSIAVLATGGIESAGESLWTILSTTINAWMPEADENILMTLLISVAAVFGLFFTSFIIGIISSGVEERLTKLREGSSKVIEENHIVLLNFKSGNYTLISQLLLAYQDEKTSIVVAGEEEKTEIEDKLKDNLDISTNIKLICRSIDCTDPVALDRVSIENASLIIVEPGDDRVTIKTLLAISSYLDENENSSPRIVTAVSDDEYMIPYETRKKYGFTMLRTNDVVGRIIAHSCTQPGLSQAFDEVFDFAGNEFYLESVPGLKDKVFKDIFYFTKGGVPIGIYRARETILNPDRNEPLMENDKLIVFENSQGNYRLIDDYLVNEQDEGGNYKPKPKDNDNLLIIGSNRKLDNIISELPDNITEITLASSDEDIERYQAIRPEISFTKSEFDILNLQDLEDLAAGFAHIVILSDEEADENEDDIETMMIIIKLRDIRKRLNKHYTITAELVRDDNKLLINNGDCTDFIVSTNMLSMVLVQIAKCEELYETFHELLSSIGNEFELKYASFIPECVGVEKSVAEIRRELIWKRCIFLGIITEDGKSKLNPPLDRKYTLAPDDKLIVIAKD